MSLSQVSMGSKKQVQLRNLAALQSCRLCIICAKTTEAMVVKKQLQATQTIPGNLVDGIAPGHDFYLGVLEAGKVKIPYYITATSRQGIQTFAVEVAALFSVLRPEYAIHTGVCAALDDGDKADIKLEDVIFGERALNYEEGKWAMDKEELIFLPDTKVLDTKSARMDGYVRSVRQSHIKYGDYISGCALRMDAQHIMHRQLRDIKALDMEASAFLQLCNHMEIHALGIIKGVSDKGDADRTQDVKAVYNQAMTNAANAVHDYLEWKLAHDPLMDADLNRQLGTQIVKGYFDNFVKVVAIKASELGLKILVGSSTVVFKGFKIVLPPNDDPSKYSSLRFYQQSWNLRELSLSGGERTTQVFAKGPYFVDFPTTITQLADLHDKTTQVDYFRQALEKALEEININPDRFKAEVRSWDEFKLDCKEFDEQEAKEKPAGIGSVSSGHLAADSGELESTSSVRALTPTTTERGDGDGSAAGPAATAAWVEAEPTICDFCHLHGNALAQPGVSRSYVIQGTGL